MASFRVCIPMSDVIHGRVDEGVKMLMDLGGEVTQKDVIVKINS